MKKHQQATCLEEIATDAKALLAATGHLAEEKVVQARKRLSAALEKGKESAIEGTKATDEAIREHPYYALGIAFAAGTLLACFLARRGN